MGGGGEEATLWGSDHNNINYWDVSPNKCLPFRLNYRHLIINDQSLPETLPDVICALFNTHVLMSHSTWSPFKHHINITGNAICIIFVNNLKINLIQQLIIITQIHAETKKCTNITYNYLCESLNTRQTAWNHFG